MANILTFFQLDVHYLHHHAAINSSIGLNPNPRLDVAAAIGSKDVAIGGEIGFDTSSSSFTKYNAGISYNKPDFSAALILYVTVSTTSSLSSIRNAFSNYLWMYCTKDTCKCLISLSITTNLLSTNI